MKARDNPFSTDRIEKVKFRPQGWSWEEILAKAIDLGMRFSITGAEGSGKTALLHELIDRLHIPTHKTLHIKLSQSEAEISWRRLLRLLTSNHRYLIIDGAESLGAAKWYFVRMLSCQLSGLIITTHKPGYLPALVHCSTSSQLLTEIVQELCPCPDPLSDEKTQELLESNHGNIRSSLLALYDIHAAQSLP